MELNVGIDVVYGDINGRIFGGKFRAYRPGTRRLVGIKMAKEISHSHDFKVDTEDFSVPDVKDMQDGVIFGLQALSEGNDIYVGCMGGIGRTGLYMGVMAKVMFDYQIARGLKVENVPVGYVRRHYMVHAIETEDQRDYVKNFDTTKALQWLKKYHARNTEVRTIHSTKIEYVDRVEYLGPFDWVLHKLFKL